MPRALLLSSGAPTASVRPLADSARLAPKAIFAAGLLPSSRARRPQAGAGLPTPGMLLLKMYPAPAPARPSELPSRGDPTASVKPSADRAIAFVQAPNRCVGSPAGRTKRPMAWVRTGVTALVNGPESLLSQ